MKRLTPLSIIVILFFLFQERILAQNLVPLPNLQERVVDTIGLLSQEERQSLLNQSLEIEQSKGSQVVVVIVSTTQPEAIEQYALRLAEKWKIGRKKIDDGVLFLIAKDDRRVRIEVGYGLEGALNDITSFRIIQDFIIPQFKNGNFYEGIDEGLRAIIKILQGEDLPKPKKKIGQGKFPLLLILFFFLIFSFLNGFGGRRNRFYYLGGGFGSGGGFSGGGGGFSGGGGGFGGGGSSGSW